MTDERVMDYRPDTPTVCECGAAVRVTGERRGEVYLSGPADLAMAAEYGITTEGRAVTIWHEYVCSNGHHGPSLMGAQTGDAILYHDPHPPSHALTRAIREHPTRRTRDP